MWIVDRFEADKAVLEYENQTFTIPKEALPNEVQEGDLLKININHEGTEQIQDDIDQLKEDLFD